MTSSDTRPSIRLFLAWTAMAWMLAGVAHADWLVTRDGERIETRGAWEVRGRVVVFTNHGGALSSIRLDEVDLEASRAATEEPEQAAAQPAAPARKPVMTLTTRDVGLGEAGAEGPELLIERLRNAHQFKDMALAMQLVNWDEAPADIRDVVETQFEWMMARRIRDVRLEDVAPGEKIEEVHNGVPYEPNVEVTHRMVVDFVPDPDLDTVSLTFHIGTHLSSYYIAAARRVEADDLDLDLEP